MGSLHSCLEKDLPNSSQAGADVNTWGWARKGPFDDDYDDDLRREGSPLEVSMMYYQDNNRNYSRGPVEVVCAPVIKISNMRERTL